MALYLKAGVKNTKIVLLLTDTHIVEERFLVPINDYLSSGVISDLCSAEERENMVASVKGEVKAAGLMDTPETCWTYFTEKVRFCFFLYFLFYRNSLSYLHITKWKLIFLNNVLKCFAGWEEFENGAVL